jgi:hypothetical protein
VVGTSAEGFTVSPDSLMQLGQRLVDLKAEFDSGVAGLEPLIGAVGHDGLREKVRQFSDNWSDKRAALSGLLEQAAGSAKQAADAYRQVDDALRQQFQQQAAPAPAPAPAQPAGPPPTPPTTQPAAPVPFLQPAKPAPPPTPPLPRLQPPTTPRGGR